MALGFGEQRIIAAIAGAWVTAFVLVAIWMPSVLVLFILGVLAFIGALILMFIRNTDATPPGIAALFRGGFL